MNDCEIIKLKAKNNTVLNIENYSNKQCWLELCKYLDIYSILRKSDGEIFTIGDSVSLTFGKGIIKEISSSDNYLRIKGAGFNYSLSILTKYTEQLLFKTEDGVDIYEGDDYWIVYDDYKLSTGCFKGHVDILKTMKTTSNLYFSSKGRAEDYCHEHKPALSLNDIMEVIPLQRGSINYNRLYKLVSKRF